MILEHGLYEITASDRELAREIKSNPSGPYRPEVMRLINRILWMPLSGRTVVVCIRNHREWCLGQLTGVRGKPVTVLDERVFNNREEALWTAFAQRWEQITGSVLEE